MNTLLLQQIRDCIAANPEKLNMRNATDPFGPAKCGCIIGFAKSILKKSDFEDFFEMYDELGLSGEQGEKLSLGEFTTFDFIEAQVTADEALNAIDTLIATGQVVWPERVKEILKNKVEIYEH